MEVIGRVRSDLSPIPPLALSTWSHEIVLCSVSTSHDPETRFDIDPEVFKFEPNGVLARTWQFGWRLSDVSARINWWPGAGRIMTLGKTLKRAAVRCRTGRHMCKRTSNA